MAIRAECSGIGKEDIPMKSKDGSKQWKIQAHTIEGVLHGVRSLFDKHGVWMEPQLIEREYSGSNRCDALFIFTFINVDDIEDRREIRWAGAGTDNTDKGFAKAGTNALKEMLKKVFLITDRFDVDEEKEKVEYIRDDGASRSEIDRAKEAAREANEERAKALRVQIEKAATLADLDGIEKANKKWLFGGDLPEVTQTFFAEALTDKRAALEDGPDYA